MTFSSGKDRLRVAILFGGKSGEHEVSLASAKSVMGAMDEERYEIYPVGITKSGHWISGGDPMSLLQSGMDEGTTGMDMDKALAVMEEGDLAEEGAPKARFPDVDVVFPVLHGTYGEDGTLQGLLELADVPYVGAGVLGSALGLDKIAQKAVLSANGLPVVPYLSVTRTRWGEAPEGVLKEVKETFSYPVFVKPANLGSSVGITKAHDRDELEAGLDLAARYDRRILVETAIDAREIECSVLGNDTPQASLPGEVVPCNEFYDYEAKYVDGDSELHIPADLDEEMVRRIQDMAVRAFLAIDCAGMARVDFFLCRDTETLYLNELNTIPGFTKISMYPKLWEASGLSYPRLIDRLIECALERYEQKTASVTSYDVKA
ncbi:MAG: D-alanine--D-alanine ligase family protein [Anaerolineales bacterium]